MKIGLVDVDGHNFPNLALMKISAWHKALGDKILDTHLGSGSIAIACHNLGFILDACEIDADYFAGAKARLEEHQRQLTFEF